MKNYLKNQRKLDNFDNLHTLNETTYMSLNKLNPNFQSLPLKNALNWDKIQPYIGKAHANLARLDTYLENLPSDEALTFSSILTKESVSSSRIEGTQTSIEQVFNEGLDSKKPSPDHQEVLNYISALKKGLDLLNELPISKRLITEVHKVLMSGVRGKNKTPGFFRTGSVYIGNPSEGIEAAKFIPPSAEKIPELFSNLENYINSEKISEDTLVQLAIIHAQFEIIHPFFDGNGRLGRMLIPLFLYSKKIVKTVHIYVSQYLEENRSDYYKRLNNITRKNDWDSWVIFFLEALTYQSQKDLELLRTIYKLHETTLNDFNDIVSSKYSSKFVSLIFKEPVIRNVGRSSKKSGIPKAMLHSYLNLFSEKGLLEKEKGGVRGSNVSYKFTKFLNILIQDNI